MGKELIKDIKKSIIDSLSFYNKSINSKDDLRNHIVHQVSLQ